MNERERLEELTRATLNAKAASERFFKKQPAAPRQRLDHIADVSLVGLYTEPPKREWVGLTDEERFKIWEKSDLKDPFSFAVDVEAKLKEKNA